MNTNEYDIGDRVRSIQYDKYGVIEDKLYSNRSDDWMYMVKFDDANVMFAKPLCGEDLEPALKRNYRYEVFLADHNVVVAVMYEINGEYETEVARYHGHIMHEGILGVAQAASYAMKKIYLKLGGTLVNRGGNNDD